MTGKELECIKEAVENNKISGDGLYTKKCHEYFEQNYHFKKVLLTTSFTDAIEMSAILANISPNYKTIAPSYTFVSTVNAFVLKGAKIKFVNSGSDNPNLNTNKIEELITPKTKAIISIRYAGIACDKDKIMASANKYNLFVIEDAAQAVDSYYKNKPLGSIGHFSAFSFHETKNIISGEGGVLVINDERFIKRAEIIREKGTNLSAFFRGEVDKYYWVDIGSSFLPSDMIAAFLFAQLENLNKIQKKRFEIWNFYYNALKSLANSNKIKLPEIPDFASNNPHMFYIICKNNEERNALIIHLKADGINSVFHYLSLHKSKYFENKQECRNLPYADYYSDCLLRLPFFYGLTDQELARVCESITNFFKIV